MKVIDWILQMKAVHTYLPILEGGDVTTMTHIKLVKATANNILMAWKIQFKLTEGYRTDTTVDSQKTLLLVVVNNKATARSNEK